MPVVELEHVWFRYGQGPFVLTDVSAVVEAGEFVAIAGPNGGGKTTLVRLAVGLERPSRGHVRTFGERTLRQRDRRRIAYLAQRAQVDVDAPVTVAELVAAGLVPVRGVLGGRGGRDRSAISDAVARVGLSDRLHTPLNSLSGGQQQRAFIAKALVAKPELLVLDEPTAGVDVDAQEALAALLGELRRDLGVTILYVSHEFGPIEPFVDRLVLVRGELVFDGDPHDLPGRWHDPSHVHA